MMPRSVYHAGDAMFDFARAKEGRHMREQAGPSMQQIKQDASDPQVSGRGDFVE